MSDDNSNQTIVPATSCAVMAHEDGTLVCCIPKDPDGYVNAAQQLLLACFYRLDKERAFCDEMMAWLDVHLGDKPSEARGSSALN